MTRFVQLHFLTAYPPSNPNRDDQGRPKTAIYGGATRLRLSSQSLKRAARLSDAMNEALKGHMGERTQRLGEEVLRHLVDKGANDRQAGEIAKIIADTFGKLDDAAIKKNPSHVRIRQLAFISPEERKTAFEWADRMFAGEEAPGNLKEQVLRTADGAVDVAMFGRMLADDPEYNREAAVQVSHAITTHRTIVEDDWYTAVDDLKQPAEDAGAGFVGEAGFGSGVYYLYACVDTGLLVKNLDGDRDLARLAIAAVAEAFATSSPSGKRNSFSHHTRAGYIRAESGSQQPRSLASAFLKPVTGDDLMGASVLALEEMAGKFDQAYGPQSDSHVTMNVAEAQGDLVAIKSFVSRQIADE
ncbi:MAG: type I-E CRISPR-associated protein Cas7/Cse4/CasC [Gammaproteobacteria bacterium]|nr:type I-E CRISPR-associated protein Cas7/Cse4/CasC [Gammaproteobacteria bacterium]